MKKEQKKEKPVPKPCKCGRDPCVVTVARRGKMVTCSDPVNCCGNFRTLWKKNRR